LDLALWGESRQEPKDEVFRVVVSTVVAMVSAWGRRTRRFVDSVVCEAKVMEGRRAGGFRATYRASSGSGLSGL
jgi:hypothetical protein